MNQKLIERYNKKVIAYERAMRRGDESRAIRIKTQLDSMTDGIGKKVYFEL